MNKIKFGILGAGSIAELMAKTIAGLSDITPYAVASRDLSRARDFANRHGIENAYGSYEEMLKDPALDLVYIATPHSHHYEQVKLCLEYDKHVLCEKAFTINAAQAEEVLALAKSKNLLLTEAIWTRYMPMSRKINELIADGVIGEVTSLTANLGYTISHVERLHNPALAGGALLDLGVYPINFASMVLGTQVKSITGSAVKIETGVDAKDSITMIYENDVMAILFANMMSTTDCKGIIYGEKAYMVVQNIDNPDSIKIYNFDQELTAEYRAPEQITGYEYEVLACIRDIRAGVTECAEMPHAETIRIMKIMDGLRSKWGVRYRELGE